VKPVAAAGALRAEIRLGLKASKLRIQGIDKALAYGDPSQRQGPKNPTRLPWRDSGGDPAEVSDYQSSVTAPEGDDFLRLERRSEMRTRRDDELLRRTHRGLASVRCTCGQAHEDGKTNLKLHDALQSLPLVEALRPPLT
jgi:hypothetical protein